MSQPTIPPARASITFTLGEIARATGCQPYGVYGVSYAATLLDISLPDGRILRFREGDDAEGDHSVEVIPVELAAFNNPTLLNPES
jgi:hypothetical protein